MSKVLHQGCLFHYLQAVSKKMKKHGLWRFYKKVDVVHLFMKKLMAIALLHPKYMESAFEILSQLAVSSKELKPYRSSLKTVVNYYQRQWMNPAIHDMITFYNADFRTNNWNESE